MLLQGPSCLPALPLGQLPLSWDFRCSTHDTGRWERRCCFGANQGWGGAGVSPLAGQALGWRRGAPPPREHPGWGEPTRHRWLGLCRAGSGADRAGGGTARALLADTERACSANSSWVNTLRRRLAIYLEWESVFRADPRSSPGRGSRWGARTCPCWCQEAARRPAAGSSLSLGCWGDALSLQGAESGSWEGASEARSRLAQTHPALAAWS